MEVTASDKAVGIEALREARPIKWQQIRDNRDWDEHRMYCIKNGHTNSGIDLDNPPTRWDILNLAITGKMIPSRKAAMGMLGHTPDDSFMSCYQNGWPGISTTKEEEKDKFADILWSRQWSRSKKEKDEFNTPLLRVSNLGRSASEYTDAVDQLVFKQLLF